MSKDDATWLRICYVLFALTVGFTATRAMDTLGVQSGWAERYSDWYSVAALATSVLLAAMATWYLAGNRERHDYFLSAIGEVRKVSWPSAVDTRRMTIVVCVVVGFFAVVLAAFDAFWAFLLRQLLA